MDNTCVMIRATKLASAGQVMACKIGREKEKERERAHYSLLAGTLRRAALAPEWNPLSARMRICRPRWRPSRAALGADSVAAPT